MALHAILRRQAVASTFASGASSRLPARLLSTEAGKRLVEVEKQGKVAIVRMNKAPVNTLCRHLLKDLRETIEELEKDKGTQAIVLASARPKVFSAGLDIMEMYKPTPDGLRVFWTALQDLWITLYSTRKATIAAIEGNSPAGGCLLAMSCDYRVMATGGYKIGLNESKLGIVAPSWFIDTMSNTIGHRHSERMLALGLQITAEEAVKINLVDEAVPMERVMERAIEEATQWTKIAEFPRSEPKRMLRQPFVDKLKQAKEQDFQAFTATCSSAPVQQSLEMYMAALKGKK